MSPRPGSGSRACRRAARAEPPARRARTRFVRGRARLTATGVRSLSGRAGAGAAYGRQQAWRRRSARCGTLVACAAATPPPDPPPTSAPSSRRSRPTTSPTCAPTTTSHRPSRAAIVSDGRRRTQRPAPARLVKCTDAGDWCRPGPRTPIGNRMINAASRRWRRSPRSARRSPAPLHPARRRVLRVVRDGPAQGQGQAGQAAVLHPAARRRRPRDGRAVRDWRDKTSRDATTTPVALDVTVITTTATDDLGRIHDRMPMLVEPDQWRHVARPGPTDPTDLRELLVPRSRRGLLEAYPVSTAVSNVQNNGPELVRADPAEGDAVTAADGSQPRLGDSDGDAVRGHVRHPCGPGPVVARLRPAAGDAGARPRRRRRHRGPRPGRPRPGAAAAGQRGAGRATVAGRRARLAPARQRARQACGPSLVDHLRAASPAGRRWAKRRGPGGLPNRRAAGRERRARAGVPAAPAGPPGALARRRAGAGRRGAHARGPGRPRPVRHPAGVPGPGVRWWCVPGRGPRVRCRASARCPSRVRCDAVRPSGRDALPACGRTPELQGPPPPVGERPAASAR